MKVLLAGQNYRITGGSDRVFFDQMDLLRQHGHEVAPFCASHSDNLDAGEWGSFFPIAASFEKPTIVDAARFIYSSPARRRIAEVLNAFSPDVVHCHIYYGKLTSSILSEVKKRRIPLVQTLHEYKIVCPVYTLLSQGRACNDCSGFRFYHAAKNRCNRGSLARSILSCAESYTSLLLGSVSKFDHFIAVSDFLRREVVRMGVPSEKVTTIHNFTDVTRFTPEYRPGSYFLYFGRLEKNKGVWPLVHAFQRMPSVPLVMVGSGAEEASLASYIESKGIGNIRMAGFLSGTRLAEAIKAACCVVVPSNWNETFGLTITEAFGYGKPVIASRIGGIPEVVTDGEDAILVEPGNVDDLIQAVQTLAMSPDRCCEMGRMGRKNVEIKFSREAHLEKLLALYRKLGVPA